MKQITTNTFVVLLGALFFWSCAQEPTERIFDRQIQLDNAPLGLALDGDLVWVSDSDANLVFQINEQGEKQKELADFDRPMHLDFFDGKVFVPEYGRDSISISEKEGRKYMEITDSLDAPAGVSFLDDKIAIADFYSNRILLFDGTKWFWIGSEGNAAGQLYYPTDVQLINDKIVVADAYNNRIQIFDWSGKSLQIIGEDQNMNATTGVFATEKEIFATDFENSRILVFNWEGEVQQVLNENLDKPTDLLLRKEELWIANYNGKSISIYSYK